jgi:hypothetical protein
MTPKEFIKSTQNDVLLNEYTLQDVIWFMTEFSKQEVSEQLTLTDVSKCDCDNHIACIVCGEEKGLDGDFWKRMKEQ